MNATLEPTWTTEKEQAAVQELLKHKNRREIIIKKGKPPMYIVGLDTVDISEPIEKNGFTKISFNDGKTITTITLDADGLPYILKKTTGGVEPLAVVDGEKVNCLYLPAHLRNKNKTMAALVVAPTMTHAMHVLTTPPTL